MWEYKIVRDTAEESQKELNKLGKEGWEVYDIGNYHDIRYNIFYFFLKRRLTKERMYAQKRKEE